MLSYGRCRAARVSCSAARAVPIPSALASVSRPSSLARIAAAGLTSPSTATSSFIFAGRSQRRWASAWAAAVKDASAVVQPASTPAEGGAIIADPLKLVGQEMQSIRQNIKSLLGSGHPALDNIAKYYFEAEGKHLRPLIVLLMAQATNGLSPNYPRLEAQGEAGTATGVDAPISRANVLNDYNPDKPNFSCAFSSTSSATSSGAAPTPSSHHIPTSSVSPSTAPAILPTQRRLAEVTEMIHVASLLHDDVIDSSPERRSTASAPALFGNKLSILAGDFLLGRASVFLARLGSSEVVELMATILANLVEGEVMQLKATTAPETKPTKEGFERYMQKTYLKTASLMAKSARSAVILGGCDARQGWVEGEMIKEAAYTYGRNLGIAFQLVDDMLDFKPVSAELGKPGEGADLRLGLATAPALYAWEEFSELGPLILRKFEDEGDVEKARGFVARSQGMQRTAELAAHHASLAKAALSIFPPSPAKEALEGLTEKVVQRSS
uniref:(2E,6E)-farnesyl diphosphate synthase n=1 Tax=Bartheletia paradoxa TaxID=669517 RepID=A0A2D0XI41_9BASI|nr:hypothetical protein SPAR06848 [Bartheletia paradoxa]